MHPVFAARGSGLIEGLSNGDPVAWGILIAVVVIGIGLQIWKSRKKKNEPVDKP